MGDAKEVPEPVFLFYNNELLHNIDLIPLVPHVHIQSNANEFLHQSDATFLFCKINQKRRHNQVDKVHQDKRYGDSMS